MTRVEVREITSLLNRWYFARNTPFRWQRGHQYRINPSVQDGYGRLAIRQRLL